MSKLSKLSDQIPVVYSVQPADPQANFAFRPSTISGMAQTSPNNMVFVVGDKEVIRLEPDAFFVNGVKVNDDPAYLYKTLVEFYATMLAEDSERRLGVGFDPEGQRAVFNPGPAAPPSITFGPGNQVLDLSGKP